MYVFDKKMSISPKGTDDANSCIFKAQLEIRCSCSTHIELLNNVKSRLFISEFRSLRQSPFVPLECEDWANPRKVRAKELGSSSARYFVTGRPHTQESSDTPGRGSPPY